MKIESETNKRKNNLYNKRKNNQTITTYNKAIEACEKNNSNIEDACHHNIIIVLAKFTSILPYEEILNILSVCPICHKMTIDKFDVNTIPDKFNNPNKLIIDLDIYSDRVFYEYYFNENLVANQTRFIMSKVNKYKDYPLNEINDLIKADLVDSKINKK